MNPIKLFQKNNGLDDDGDIGRLTLAKMAEVFKIDSKEHLSHHLGQASHETGGFKSSVENLNYSAKGMAETWPTRYAVDPKAKVKVPNALALRLQRKPEAIANNCYANRMGNGDEASGDGWKYRGRGDIMLTGKEQYRLMSIEYKDPEILKNPEIVATKYYFQTGLFYFKQKNLWRLCNQVNDASIAALTLKINGGYIGLKHRAEETYKYYDILNQKK